MRIDAFSAALSGIRSSTTRQAVSAHNVANLTSEEFRPLRTQQAERQGGGSEARVVRAAEPEPVELSHEIVEQIRARVQFEASLGVLRTPPTSPASWSTCSPRGGEGDVPCIVALSPAGNE